MSINILEECSYLLNDGRYVQVQAKNSKHVYAFYSIVKEVIQVNDNSVNIEDIILNRFPELILDCRILRVIEPADFMSNWKTIEILLCSSHWYLPSAVFGILKSLSLRNSQIQVQVKYCQL